MNSKDGLFKFDRTAFRAATFEEANDHYRYWSKKTLRERLEAGMYLSMQMYGCNIYTPMDKTVFDKRKHADG